MVYYVFIVVMKIVLIIYSRKELFGHFRINKLINNYHNGIHDYALKHIYLSKQDFFNMMHKYVLNKGKIIKESEFEKRIDSMYNDIKLVK